MMLCRATSCRREQPSLLAGLLWLASVPSAAAQQGDLLALADESMMFGEVPSVFSVSRYEESVPEAPASTTVITRDVIRQHGYRSLAEALAGVRGFSTSGDGSYTYVGVRGILRPGDYNSRILVLVDGHRLNDAVYDGALVGNEGPVDMELIERIEVTRGPGSSVYGANAMLAVVNILTHQASSIQGSEAAVETDSKGLRRVRAVAAGSWAGAETLFSVSTATRKGQSLPFASRILPPWRRPSPGRPVTWTMSAFSEPC